MGALEGGSPMWRVPSHVFYNFPIDLKTYQCPMSNLRIGLCHVAYFFFLLLGSMSHVDFNKWPCGPVEFQGH